MLRAAGQAGGVELGVDEHLEVGLAPHAASRMVVHVDQATPRGASNFAFAHFSQSTRLHIRRRPILALGGAVPSATQYLRVATGTCRNCAASSVVSKSMTALLSVGGSIAIWVIPKDSPHCFLASGVDVRRDPLAELGFCRARGAVGVDESPALRVTDGGSIEGVSRETEELQVLCGAIRHGAPKVVCTGEDPLDTNIARLYRCYQGTAVPTVDGRC